MMTEIEKIQRAKMYIDKLANGIDPISDTELENDTILNNVRLARCFFYVSDVLSKVIENGGEVKISRKSSPFFITEEEIKSITVSDTAIAVSELCKLISNAVNNGSRGRLSATTVTGWLVSKGFLQVITTPDGKNKKIPTDIGSNLGIITERRTSLRGDYDVNLYNKQAQQFILDNLTAVLQEKLL